MGLRDQEQASGFMPSEPQPEPFDEPVPSPTVFKNQGQIPEVAPDLVPGQTASQLAFGEEAPAKKVELTADQVADAKRYYTSQPWKYTKQVITEIQNKVGATATGRIDDDTVQKVATFQAEINDSRKPNPPLVVDGKAGPRTLPILLPTGLATNEQIDAFVTEVKSEEKELEKLPLQPRADMLLEDVNKRLAAVDVPVPPIKEAILDDALNEFAAGTWRMKISRKTLANPNDAAQTMYHEARHAEQSFRIARMLAGEGHGKQSIKNETGIADDAIVDAAIAAKLTPGTVEAVQAKGWHEDEPGRPTQAQQDARMRDSAVAFGTAAKEFKANETPENKAKAAAAYEEFKKTQIEAYRDRPNEYDAFFVGDKVSDKLGVKRDNDFPPLDEAIEIAAKA